MVLSKYCIRQAFWAATILGVSVSAGAAQEPPSLFSTASWCNDSGTICWKDSPTKSVMFTGIRFIGEPSLGTVIQRADNRFESALISGLIQTGVEINAFKGIVAFQGTFIPPGSIQLDKDSPLVTSGRLADPERRMKVDVGFGFGLSVLDGIFALGKGKLYYDTRTIAEATADDRSSSFYYVNIQPISAIRVLIKRSKSDPTKR